MNELHLFAGAGGGILGSELLGFRTVCAKNGDFSKGEGGAIAYAWFHWAKGHRGDCTIKWL